LLVKDYRNASPINLFSLVNEMKLFNVFNSIIDCELTVIGDLGDDLGRVLVPEGEVILIVNVQALL
jgi:hypothetical protein